MPHALVPPPEQLTVTTNVEPELSTSGVVSGKSSADSWLSDISKKYFGELAPGGSTPTCTVLPATWVRFPMMMSVRSSALPPGTTKMPCSTCPGAAATWIEFE